MSEPTTEQTPAERWYLPSWWDRLHLMRWRLIYFLPAVLVLALVVFMPWSILLWWKLLIIVVGLPMTAAVNTAKHAVALRKEPFCIHCGYELTGLPEGHPCPECGVPFSLLEIDDYRRDPHWFIRRRTLNRELPQAGAVIEAGPVRSKRRRDGT